RGQTCQRHTIPLAAAQLSDALKRLITADTKSRQQVPTLLLVELLAGRAHRVDGLQVARERLKHLVEVADPHAGPPRSAPVVRTYFPCHAPQQCCLAGPVAADDPPALPAQDVECKILKQRPIKGLTEPLDADDDVAAASHLGKSDRRRFDLA